MDSCFSLFAMVAPFHSVLICLTGFFHFAVNDPFSSILNQRPSKLLHCILYVLFAPNLVTFWRLYLFCFILIDTYASIWLSFACSPLFCLILICLPLFFVIFLFQLQFCSYLLSFNASALITLNLVWLSLLSSR